MYYYYYYYYYHHHCLLYQGSHTHIPETNHVPRGYTVATIVSLLFIVPLCLVPALVLLFFYVGTFRSMCAVPSMAVFCSSLTSWFPGMSLTYFLNDLEMVPVAPFVTGITLVFTFHMRCISIVRSLYFKIFSASFLIAFLSLWIATSINMHVLFSLLLLLLFTSYLLNFVLTYLPTPWIISLLEKLTGSQLVKKFRAFYGTRRFITAFTSAHHLPYILLLLLLLLLLSFFLNIFLTESVHRCSCRI